MCAASFGSAEHVRRRPCCRGNASGFDAPCVKTAAHCLHSAPRSVTFVSRRQRGTRSKIAGWSSRSIVATAPLPCDAGVSGDGGVQGNFARSRLRSGFYRHTPRNPSEDDLTAFVYRSLREAGCRNAPGPGCPSGAVRPRRRHRMRVHRVVAKNFRRPFSHRDEYLRDVVFLLLPRTEPRKVVEALGYAGKPNRSCRPGSNDSMTIRGTFEPSRSPGIGDPGPVSR